MIGRALTLAGAFLMLAACAPPPPPAPPPRPGIYLRQYRPPAPHPRGRAGRHRPGPDATSADNSAPDDDLRERGAAIERKIRELQDMIGPGGAVINLPGQ